MAADVFYRLLPGKTELLVMVHADGMVLQARHHQHRAFHGRGGCKKILLVLRELPDFLTEVEVEIPTGLNARARRLNKETAAPAVEQPDSFWSADAATPLGTSHVRLAPFELVFVDQPSLPEAF